MVQTPKATLDQRGFDSRRFYKFVFFKELSVLDKVREGELGPFKTGEFIGSYLPLGVLLTGILSKARR